MIEFTDENKVLWILSGGLCVHCGVKREDDLQRHCNKCNNESIRCPDVCREWWKWITTVEK